MKEITNIKEALQDADIVSVVRVAIGVLFHAARIANGGIPPGGTSGESAIKVTMKEADRFIEYLAKEKS